MLSPVDCLKPGWYGYAKQPLQQLPVRAGKDDTGRPSLFSCALAKPGRCRNRTVPRLTHTVDRGGYRPVGFPSLAQTYHMGALRSGLAIGEVQALVNPCTGSGERGVSPASLILWTVVGITLGVGTGEGACPIYANFSYKDSGG